MPKTFSDEFKQHAVSRAIVAGVPGTARELGVSAPALRNWVRQKKLEEGIPTKFSPELKERAVELAAQYGTSVAARMLGVSSDSVRAWQRIKKATGSAAAPDPRRHSKQQTGAARDAKEQPEQSPEQSKADNMNLKSIISSTKWALAIYKSYAKEPSEDGFAEFKEWLDDYARLVQQETENE